MTTSYGDDFASFIFSKVCPGLYFLDQESSNTACYLYFVPIGTSQIFSSDLLPSLDHIWNDPAWAGWLIYTDKLISSEAAEIFVDTVTTVGKLPPLKTDNYTAFPGVAWVENPNNWDGSSKPFHDFSWLLVRPNDSPPTPKSLRFLIMPKGSSDSNVWKYGWTSHLTLSISNRLPISLITTESGLPALQISAVKTDSKLIRVVYKDVIKPDVSTELNGEYSWQVKIPLSGPNSGSFCCPVGLQPKLLAENFHCGFFFAFGEPASLVSYPFLQSSYPFDTNPALETYVAFDLALNPIVAKATRLSLHLDSTTWPCHKQDCVNASSLVSSYFFGTNGYALKLTPFAELSSNESSTAPGFALSVAPAKANESDSTSVRYLSPVGRFRVTSLENTLDPTLDWMCGLSAQEFVRIAQGDVIEFVSDLPAYAPWRPDGTPTHDDEIKVPLLTDKYTTSWIMYPVAGTVSQVGYFSQPRSYVYYSADTQISSPTDVMLSDFSSGSSTFPMVPYGGINAKGDIPSPQSVKLIKEFENKVLIPTRYQNIQALSTGPRFLSPSVSGDENSQELRAVATSQGLLIELSPAITNADLSQASSWQRLVLASSPSDPSVKLSFDCNSETGRVSPSLANALMQDGAFLVMTNAEDAAPFSNDLHIDGFHFHFNVATGKSFNSSNTLLLFKFNTQLSLRELTELPNLWTARDTFVGDTEAVTEAQKKIIDAIEVGQKHNNSEGDPFGFFNKLVDDVEWTGILALNVPVNGSSMSPDLQMLLGGMDGQLSAHHLSIQNNKISNSNDSYDLDSSIFGLISYSEASPSSPEMPKTKMDSSYSYKLEQLLVQINNSKIVLFDVRVGLTINQVFGRDVRLLNSSSNTLSLNGTYQTRNGVGSVIFDSNLSFVYEMVEAVNCYRVIERVKFDSAMLVPLKSESKDNEEKEVIARFAMTGQLWFRSNPFPGTDLDLMSYGIENNVGLKFSNFTVDVGFTLDANGAHIPDKPTICTVRPELLIPLSTPEAIRPNSLLANLPLKLTNFAYSDMGLSAITSGALPVHCPQLISGLSPDAVVSAPYVTESPQYALKFELPLGSLGSLSEVHAGISASLLLGWGPSPVTPDSDALGILIQLPQLNAGYQGFELQGFLRTEFGDANLIRVDTESGLVYALLFNNVHLNLFGYTFPPGVMIDFMLFAGPPEQSEASKPKNLAWFLGAKQPQ